MHEPMPDTKRRDVLKKAFLWLIIFDYLLLAFFLTQLSSLNLNSGTMISLLLVVYNVLLVSLCFQRTNKQDSYIIYQCYQQRCSLLSASFTFFFLV